MHDALVHGAIAKESHRNSTRLSPLFSESVSAGDGNAAPDDGVGAHDAESGVAQMHRSTRPAGPPVLEAEDFMHHRLDFYMHRRAEAQCERIKIGRVQRVDRLGDALMMRSMSA